jgi:hypothetical protein
MESPSPASHRSPDEHALAASIARCPSAVSPESGHRHPAVEAALHDVRTDCAIDELSHPWDARLAPARSQPWGASRLATRFDDFGF